VRNDPETPYTLRVSATSCPLVSYDHVIEGGILDGGNFADKTLVKLANVIAAMRNLIHIVFGVLKNKLPFDQDYYKQFAFHP
jgi:hypothetical protein